MRADRQNQNQNQMMLAELKQLKAAAAVKDKRITALEAELKKTQEALVAAQPPPAQPRGPEALQ